MSDSWALLRGPRLTHALAHSEVKGEDFRTQQPGLKWCRDGGGTACRRLRRLLIVSHCRGSGTLSATEWTDPDVAQLALFTSLPATKRSSELDNRSCSIQAAAVRSQLCGASVAGVCGNMVFEISIVRGPLGSMDLQPVDDLAVGVSVLGGQEANLLRWIGLGVWECWHAWAHLPCLPSHGVKFHIGLIACGPCPLNTSPADRLTCWPLDGLSKPVPLQVPRILLASGFSMGMEGSKLPNTAQSLSLTSSWRLWPHSPSPPMHYQRTTTQNWMGHPRTWQLFTPKMRSYTTVLKHWWKLSEVQMSHSRRCRLWVPQSLFSYRSCSLFEVQTQPSSTQLCASGPPGWEPPCRCDNSDAKIVSAISQRHHHPKNPEVLGGVPPEVVPMGPSWWCQYVSTSCCRALDHHGQSSGPRHPKAKLALDNLLRSNLCLAPIPITSKFGGNRQTEIKPWSRGSNLMVPR